MQERRLFTFTKHKTKLETPSTEQSGERSEDPMEIMVKLFVCSGRIYQQELWVHKLGLCSIHIGIRQIHLVEYEVEKLIDDVFIRLSYFSMK